MKEIILVLLIVSTAIGLSHFFTIVAEPLWEDFDRDNLEFRRD